MQPIRAASRSASPMPTGATRRSASAPSPSSRRASRIGSRAGRRAGDRVAIMLEPSLAFYAALFGTMKLGAIAVPLFTLFGPDGVRLRVDDCTPRLLLTTSEKAQIARHAIAAVVVAGRGLRRVACRDIRPSFAPTTRGDDLAIYQYTSGTTRELPAADPPHASRHRRGDDRGALRHRHPPGRPVLLSVIAGLGPWAVARHAGAAGAWRRDRRLCRPLRCGAAAACAAGFRHHQSVGGGDALPA